VSGPHLNVPHGGGDATGAAPGSARPARCGARGRGYPEPIAVLLAYPDPPLRTAAFELRPFRPADFDAADAFTRDPTTARWVPPLPSDDPDLVVALFERYRTDGDLLHLVIADPVADAYLGEVMLVMDEHDVGEVGCGVVPGRRGAGVATSALRLLNHWCAHGLGITRLQALVAADNLPGLRLAERVGFRREGLLRAYWGDGDERLDVVMHSLLRDEVPPVD
jgi:RimJ/RimL family protein N-acetyltransferase